jgi:hypothetical protein
MLTVIETAKSSSPPSPQPRQCRNHEGGKIGRDRQSDSSALDLMIEKERQVSIFRI